MSTIVLDATEIEQAITDMASKLIANQQDAPWAVIGIKRGGEALAHRLAAHIEKLSGQIPPIGMVDITLYRDDGFGPHDWPVVGSSQIPFKIPQYTVILADDVLYTGRTVRAAFDAILDYGRPKAIRLAVLIDRGLRELPIAADVVGKIAATAADDHVDVTLGKVSNLTDIAIITKREGITRQSGSSRYISGSQK
ncbi:MAG: bifunctional pyr operon transcriptional regulator/uracil phosphoribosyltransferase PyrR [Deltaproteobacteria bacterium]|nr:bifunctional pyr operon transcriptional regulator/uracil phosphoribosyltransferase PyrR [Deltaproteobacteria bacterium]